MTNKRDKCVYIHQLAHTKKVFYVGLGNKRRPYSERSRSGFWNSIAEKYNYEVLVIAEGLTLEEAAHYEEVLIAHYGRRDLGTGTLVNLTSGGEGTKAPSDERREQMSIQNTGSGNPFYGKSHTQEHTEKLRTMHSKSVIDRATGKIYTSAKEAAKDFKFSYNSLRNQLNGNDNRQSYNTFYYV